MVYDNSSYTVTAPDLYLTDDGITILIVTQNEHFSKRAKELFERYIISSLVFYESKNITNENNVAWEYFVSKQADLMIVDMDTCEYVDLCVALRRPHQEGKCLSIKRVLKEKYLEYLPQKANTLHLNLLKI